MTVRNEAQIYIPTIGDNQRFDDYGNELTVDGEYLHDGVPEHCVRPDCGCPESRLCMAHGAPFRSEWDRTAYRVRVAVNGDDWRKHDEEGKGNEEG